MMPADFSGKKIGIVGGNGGLGRWFARFFRERGFFVAVSDFDTTLSNEALARTSDIVILSTPMATARALAQELGPLLSKDQIFADFSSLKEEVIRAMVEKSCAEVLGIHPMCGQYTVAMQGQNMILTPGRGISGVAPFRRLFEEAGATVSIMDPSSHDRHMAFVQSVTHLVTLATGAYMQKEGLDPDTARSVGTLIFRLNLDFVGRLFALDLGLYDDLIARNPYAREASGIFAEVLAETRERMLDGEPDARRAWMEELQSFLGPFCQEALLESNGILDQLSSLKGDR